MTQLRICILGGSGFVGRRVCGKLSKLGHLLTIPTRHAAEVRKLAVLPNAHGVIADVHDPEQLSALLKDHDVAINLIGILAESGKSSGSFQGAHVELARKLVEACKTAKVPRLIQMSSLKAAADAPSKYLRTKAEAEALIRESSADIDWTILQPSVIFGSEDQFTNRFAGLLKMPVFPLARPNARFGPVFVDDVAKAVVAVLANPGTAGKTLQLCGPKIYSLRELIGYIRKTTRTPGVTIGLPDPLARLQARIFERLPGKLFTMDQYRSLTVNSICDKNGFQELGIKPRSLESIAPTYLAGEQKNARLSEFRRTAGRR